MGGFGSGGLRPGAGRKSKRTHERRLTGARARTMSADAPKVAAVAVPMPAGLTREQVAAWQELAPFALEAGTLVPATAEAFRDLCEVVALRRSMLATLSVDGLMVNVVTENKDGEKVSLGPPVAHPLLAHERQYRLREEAGKARFMVAPVGKPMGGAKPVEIDPFAEFDGPKLAVNNG